MSQDEYFGKLLEILNSDTNSKVFIDSELLSQVSVNGFHLAETSNRKVEVHTEVIKVDRTNNFVDKRVYVYFPKEKA